MFRKYWISFHDNKEGRLLLCWLGELPGVPSERSEDFSFFNVALFLSGIGQTDVTVFAS